MNCHGDTHLMPDARTKSPGSVCACGKTRFCNQGWHWVRLELFGKAKKNCKGCTEKYKHGGAPERTSRPRRNLPIAGTARYELALKSGNRKLGGIPAVIASGESCPPSCGFYGRGCYAEFGLSGLHWRRASATGMGFGELLMRLLELPEGQLWRYAVAGDLPGVGDELDVDRLALLVQAAGKTRGFTFTHKPLRTAREALAVLRANQAGFTINLSADTLEQADERAEQLCGPVAVVLPADASGDIRTPAGRRVVVCPSQVADLDCARCQLCYRADRKGIVGFLAHGQMKKTVSRVATGQSRKDQ